MRARHLRLVGDDEPAPATTLRSDPWLAPAVTVARGTLGDVAKHVPLFERRPFRVTTGLISLTADHPRWDVVARIPNNHTYCDVPVGVVSKTYGLVQHRDVLGAVTTALFINNIDPRVLSCELHLSQYAERMQIHVRFPSEYDFDPGDGHKIGLTLHAANSVDGTTRLSMMLGWFRYICSNGLVVGTTAGRARYVHRTGVRLASFDTELKAALKRATHERSVLQQWTRVKVPPESVAAWADTAVTRQWGVKAATRAFNIFMTGRDVRLTHPFESGRASERRVELLHAVPGACGDSLYTASQVLAWLAKERADHEERLKWLIEIPRLIRSLSYRAE